MFASVGYLVFHHGGGDGGGQVGDAHQPYVAHAQDDGRQQVFGRFIRDQFQPDPASLQSLQEESQT